MVCPVCTDKALMNITTVAGTFERCPGCMGLFIPWDVLAPFSEDAAAFTNSLNQLRAFLLPTGRICPHCYGRLGQGRFPDKDAVVTVCAVCKYVWTSPTDLDALDPEMAQAVLAQTENPDVKAVRRPSRKPTKPADAFAFPGLSDKVDLPKDRSGADASSQTTDFSRAELERELKDELKRREEELLRRHAEESKKIQEGLHATLKDKLAAAEEEQSRQLTQLRKNFADLEKKRSDQEAQLEALMNRLDAAEKQRALESQSQAQREESLKTHYTEEIKKHQSEHLKRLESVQAQMAALEKKLTATEKKRIELTETLQQQEAPAPKPAPQPAPEIPKPTPPEPVKTPPVVEKKIPPPVVTKPVTEAPKPVVPEPVKAPPVIEKKAPPIVPKPVRPAQPPLWNRATAFLKSWLVATPKKPSVSVTPPVSVPIQSPPPVAPPVIPPVVARPAPKPAPAPVQKQPVQPIPSPVMAKTPSAPKKNTDWVSLLITWSPRVLPWPVYLISGLIEESWGRALFWAIAAWALTYIVRLWKMYPSKTFKEVTVGELAGLLDTSASRGVAVTLKGQLDAGDSRSAPLNFKDSTGVIPLNRLSKLEMIPLVFGLTASGQYPTGEFVLKGWYRPSKPPSIEVSEARGEKITRTSLVKPLRYAGAIMAFLFAVVLLFVIE